MTDLKIPVGISDFAKIRKYHYYYVDKTGLIEDLLEKETAEVTLITRPRRFGKTMGMSMLANFFDIRRDSQAMFEGSPKILRCAASGGTGGRCCFSRSSESMAWTLAAPMRCFAPSLLRFVSRMVICRKARVLLHTIRTS